MHPCQGKSVAIVVYYARTARAFSAGIKCVHCIMQGMTLHDKDISMHENEYFAPKTSMDENSMHEIEHSSISHEHFRGKKSSKDFFWQNFHFHAWKYHFH